MHLIFGIPVVQGDHKVEERKWEKER